MGLAKVQAWSSYELAGMKMVTGMATTRFMVHYSGVPGMAFGGSGSA